MDPTPGRGRALGGFLFMYLDQRLTVLGSVFILAVYFPGGLASVADRLGPLKRLKDFSQ